MGGALAGRERNAGGAWVRLSWVRGFQQLGADVIFVDQIGRESCVDEQGELTPFAESVNLAYFERVVGHFGLDRSAALIYEDGQEFAGLTRERLLDAAASADLLVNISGHLTWEPLLSRAPRLAFVDLDPGFTQFWEAAGLGGSRLARHDLHFTIAENFGAASCAIPAAGVHWRVTRQPIVLRDWPVAPCAGATGFTTVGALRGPFAPVQHGGRTYGLKIHELRKFVTLPQRVEAPFELAMSIHPGDHRDRDALLAHGWRIVDPRVALPDPEAFRGYVQASGAEFSVAQGMYVDTASGWFSDRTVRYLASGKPALVQETGFSRNLPAGEGLVPFTTLEDAVTGADRIAADYAGHCQAARAVAEKYFDSDLVLGRFLEDAGLPA